MGSGVSMRVTWEESDKFVEDQQAKGNDFYWDQYTIVHFKPHPAGFYNGIHRNGQYGFESRFEINAKGDYHVTRRLVK